MFPVDTIKTIRQVRQQQVLSTGGTNLSEAGIAAQLHRLASVGGMARMWRGVQTMFTGCVPAHAAYFTIYEGSKPLLTRRLAQGAASRAAATAGGGGGAGGAVGGAVGGGTAAAAAGIALAMATTVHDMIMTPMDVCKQRLQLGFHKNSVIDCACDILRREGARAFWISYPTTLLMNVPVCGGPQMHA